MSFNGKNTELSLLKKSSIKITVTNRYSLKTCAIKVEFDFNYKQGFPKS
jgi:hypothetical protein